MVSKVVTSLFLLAFLAGGVFLTHQFWTDLSPRLQSITWAETECTIEKAAIVDRGPTDPDSRHLFEVRYRYRAFGESFVGDTYRVGYSGSDDVSATETLLDEYSAGSLVTCWYDPDQPDRSALRKGRLSSALVLGFPLFFVLLPLVILAFVWRRRSSARTAHASADNGPAATESITQPTAGKGSPGCVLGFFAVFAIFGLGFLIPFFILPGVKVLTARSWTETSCRILESSVRSHDGDDGDTYSIAVLYSYQVDGREYRSSRYKFMSGSSSGYDRKQRIVEGLVPGSDVTCYFDPDRPSEAVIDRGLTLDFLFAVIPLIFVIFGLGGMYFGFRVITDRATGSAEPSWLPQRFRRREWSGSAANSDSWGPSRSTVTSDSGSTREGKPSGFGSDSAFSSTGTFGSLNDVPQLETYASQDEPIELEEPLGAKGRLIGILVIALFWNGFISIFVWTLASEWRSSGSLDGCSALALLPFVLIGLALLAGVPYQFLAMANPRPLLTLSRGAIPVGESARLSWRFEGAAHRLHRLEMTVIGEEVAQYRRGTNTHTSRSRFAEIPLLDPSSGLQIARGSTEITIPADTMHSFVASRNRIEWRLKVRGWIRRWPDVIAQFPLTVLPPRSGSGKTGYR